MAATSFSALRIFSRSEARSAGSGRTRRPARADSLAIVEALKPQAARPIRAPYTFGWLPKGLRVIAAEQSPAGGSLTIYHGRPKAKTPPPRARP